MPSILRHVPSRRMRWDSFRGSARTIPTRFHVLFEVLQSRLEAGHVIAHSFHIVAEFVNFVTAGNCPAFLLEIFAEVLAQRGAGLSSPVAHAARQVAESVRRDVSDHS